MEIPEAEPDDRFLAQLQRYLPPQRVQHSLNVAQEARELALLHFPELAAPAWRAGLLHDNAKYMSRPELLEHARRAGLPVCAIEEANPGLLHGKVGAALLQERFGVADPEVGRAVEDHVTGRRGMGPLSLILYVADQIAEDRQFDGVEDVRRTARQDLVRAAAEVSRFKLLYVLAAAKPILVATVEVYNDLYSRLQGSHE